MKWLAGTAFLMMVAVQPVCAGELEFDPDQPFKGMGERLFESFLSQALQALDDHFEMSGNMNPDSREGDRKRTLRFKFYPNGKSKSNEHVAAEGSFGPSKDSREDEFHFRFSIPKSLTQPLAERPENVL